MAIYEQIFQFTQSTAIHEAINNFYFKRALCAFEMKDKLKVSRAVALNHLYFKTVYTLNAFTKLLFNKLMKFSTIKRKKSQRIYLNTIRNKQQS